MRTAFLATVLLLTSSLTPTQTRAQAPADAMLPCTQVAAGLSYDVVSIHPNRTQNGNFAASWANDRFSATNVQLTWLVEQAFSLRQDQITGIPGSIASIHYDVEAKALGSDPAAPVKLSDRQLQCMLIPLLADRFHLRSHRETRTMQTFDLVLGKGGSKLTLAAPDAKGGNYKMQFHESAWELTANATTMANFAAMLGRERQRTVIDKTGLPGRYNFTLKWSRDTPSDPDADAAPSLFTALQEQLGLKLQPSKGPVDTLVVDHAEPPTEN